MASKKRRAWGGKVLYLGKVIISIKKIFRNWVGGPELEVSGKLQANFVRYLCIRDLIC